MKRLLLLAACAGAVAAGWLLWEPTPTPEAVAAADGPKPWSGPAAGQSVPAFNPLNVTGPDAGDKRCQV